MAMFDEKALHAICVAYGNYRAAISAASVDESGAHDEYVVHTGKALLALQEYMQVHVADTALVESAVKIARENVMRG